MTKFFLLMNKMLDHPDLGKLVLRLAVGGMMFLHGYSKLGADLSGIAGMLSSHGLPSFLVYGVYLGELIAPILVMLGILTRLSALVIVGNMLMAVLLAHMGQIFTLNNTGGWGIELQAFYIFGALTIAFLGAGKFSVVGNSSWK